MTVTVTIETLYSETMSRAVNQAVRAIPPAWPLSATVAVNPFLGQTNETFDQTAARLARIGGVRLAMQRTTMQTRSARARSSTRICLQHSSGARISTT